MWRWANVVKTGGNGQGHKKEELGRFGSASKSFNLFALPMVTLNRSYSAYIRLVEEVDKATGKRNLETLVRLASGLTFSLC